jgi:hypothetical protein
MCTRIIFRTADIQEPGKEHTTTADYDDDDDDDDNDELKSMHTLSAPCLAACMVAHTSSSTAKIPGGNAAPTRTPAGEPSINSHTTCMQAHWTSKLSSAYRVTSHKRQNVSARTEPTSACTDLPEKGTTHRDVAGAPTQERHNKTGVHPLHPTTSAINKR